MKCLNGIQQFVLMALYRATKFIIATKEVGSGHHEWKTQNSPDAYLCQMSKFHHQNLDFERASSNVHSLCEIILFNSTAMEIHLCKNFPTF